MTSQTVQLGTTINVNPTFTICSSQVEKEFDDIVSMFPLSIECMDALSDTLLFVL